LFGAIVCTLTGVALLAMLAGLRGVKSAPGSDFSFTMRLYEIIQPAGINGWMQLAGVVVCGLAAGLVTAALSAVRRGSHDLTVSEDHT
jgi:hypothetical protein